MNSFKLSEAEKCFIIDGVNEDFRLDGRKCWDRREVALDVGLLSTCAGSSELRCGKNHVLVGIKADLVDPEPEWPSRGMIQFFAHQSGPASELDNNLTDEITSIFENSFDGCKLLDKLSVVEGKSVWRLYVDILILEEESKASLYDVCSIAVKAALIRTRLPKVFLNSANELEISDQESDSIILDVNDVPIFITVTKIGNVFLIDPTEEEETASISSVILSVNNQGDIIYAKKLQSGGLHFDPVKEVFQKLYEHSQTLEAEIKARCIAL